MRRISFRTAGESHGRGLLAILEGLPAGLPLSIERDVDPDMKRRMAGYGRGRRMQIEADRIELEQFLKDNPPERQGDGQGDPD